MKAYLETVGLALLAVFAPVEGVLAAVLAMIAADLITGVLAAHKRGEKITSAGIRRTVTKFFVYEVAILLSFICEKYLMGSTIPVVKLISGLVGATEIKSCLENLNEIGGGDLLKQVITKIGSDNQQGQK